MADQLLMSIQDLFEGQIDFQGQKLAELITTYLLAGFGILAFILGYVQQNIYITLWAGLGGAALTTLVVVPPWPFYNQHPEKWMQSELAGQRIEVDGKKIA